MLRQALIILSKDLRLRARDRSVLLFALVVPLGLTFVFSLVFPSEEEFQLEAAVVDLDGGQVAAGFTDGLLPALIDEGVVTLTEVADEAAARASIDAGDIAAAWILPDGFSDAVTAGRGGELRVIADPDRTLATEVARGVARAYTTELDRISLAVATTATAGAGGFTQEQLEQVAADAVAADTVVAVEELVAPDRQLDPTSYLAAGMAVFFLFFTVQFGITGYLEEREQGTLPRLLAAPLGIGTVHLGKALGAFLLGLVSMTVLAIASTVLLGAVWGDPVGVGVLILAGVVAALGVMVLLGSFARTAEQAGNLQSIVALVFGLTGGVFFPVGTGALASLSLASPHGWFLRGLSDLAGADRWTAVLPAAGVLLVFGVAFALPGIARLRRVQP